ncbi:hypothetical protein Neut_2494 [Nitrosomonas eutropha C91]|uniref:Transposase n=1 Tax=Nitrosomonas eutropha (strain DSM 101675 / C91 / Nm57) TaxID=335283 RepID=Q0AD81_NITEC|nr:hypothetical protein Neut_2494 [Nitrosomonas eutropha C91]
MRSLRHEKNYPSDISREQFEIIKLLLERLCWKTYPRRIDLSEVFRAVLCIYLGVPANGACCSKSFPNGASTPVLFHLERITRRWQLC